MKTIERNDKFFSVDNISKSYGNFLAVDDVSFEIKKGEIFGLLGPNGAGKTTVIKSILGEIQIENGNISLLGFDALKNQIEFKSLIGYVPEDSFLYESMTPEKLFNFILSIRQTNDNEKFTIRLQEYLSILDLTQYYKKPIVALSKGTKRKIEIIAALLHNPKLIIMDEPYNGIDPVSIASLNKILRMHVNQGASILFSTHILEVIEKICDRVCILDRGKKLFDGTIKELSKEGNETDFEKLFLRLMKHDENLAISLKNLQEAIK